MPFLFIAFGRKGPKHWPGPGVFLGARAHQSNVDGRENITQIMGKRHLLVYFVVNHHWSKRESGVAKIVLEN